MKVKRYIAYDYQEALKMIKSEMGSDAIILHQNRIKNKGIIGFFQKRKVEVVAAVEDYPTTLINESITKSDINEIKSLIKNLNTVKNNDLQDQDSIFGKLISYGIDAELSEMLCTGIQSFDDEGINLLQQKINNFIGMPQRLDTKEKKRVLFIGPTGVGKTTTIAKIASNLILNEKKRVILVTADIFRIAGAEQLKTYGDILGIPVKVVNNIFELHKFQHELEQFDIVLIDTAGRSHKDEKKINELKTFVKYSNCNEIYLCLSAATKSNDLKNIIKKYEFAGNYKLLFTKLDETDNYSSILNAKFYAKKPLSYFTNGQIVPDDIYLANVDRIAWSIVKGN